MPALPSALEDALPPVVSVVLPVYNGATTLRSAVLSILAQTLGSLELIVLDDGSGDGSMARIADITDPRLRVVADSRNAGLAARLNQGVDMARGRYIARMDQDDISLPQRLERQVAYLDAHLEVDLLAVRALVFRDEQSVPVGLLPARETHAEIAARPWRGVPMPHPTWMGRTAWFRRHRYWLPEYVRSEDQELLLRALPESRYHTLQEVLFAYRLTGFDFNKLQRGRRALLAVQSRIFRERGQWAWWLLAMVVFVFKTGVDAVTHLLGSRRLFDARMGEPVPEHALAAFRAAVEHCAMRHDAGPQS